jgi:glycosyltransferase involved in cell wall biosynthesis
LLKIPIIFRGETNLLRLNKEEGLKRFIKEKLLRIFFSKCAAFLPIGKLNKIYYEYFGVPSEKMFLCPYAVDNDFFIRQKQALVPIKDDLRRQYGIPVDKTAILFIGKFLSKKRPTDLLNAFKHMKNNSICSLVFVGDGPLKEELIMSVRERDLSDVHFMGFMNQSDIGKIYGICDIFVFPSDFEPYGLVLNEAMCFGLPVVVSDEISAGYDLVDGNGFVYPAGNVAKLAEYLDRLAENKILRERMGKKSSDIISRWNYDRDVKAIHAALEYVSK